MSFVVCRCHLPEEDRPLLMLHGIVRRWYLPTNTPQLMLPTVVRCRIPEAHWPWLMLPYISQCKGHQIDTQHHDQFLKDLVDVVFHFPTFLARCAHAMLDLFSGWLMLSSIRWRRLLVEHKTWTIMPYFFDVDDTKMMNTLHRLS